MANNFYLLNIFPDLGSRLQSENNLSDVTWALARNFDNFIGKEKAEGHFPYFFLWLRQASECKDKLVHKISS